jgi:multiple sugar transport system substrate-binding protein/putative aldouronate transport system substrate-binding protein
MIFAENEAKFDALWEEMVTKVDGNDFDLVVQFDLEKWQLELDAKNKAMENQ